MGWPRSGLVVPVSCLMLVWAAGSGGVKVLTRPTCFSDYVVNSICEWKTAGPTNCSTEFLLSCALVAEQRDPDQFENYTCVPKNKEDTVCTCSLLMDTATLFYEDIYTLSLWSGQQLLREDSFQPSKHVRPRAPENLTIDSSAPDMLLLTWDNPYMPSDHLYPALTYLVNISNENDPSDFKVEEVDYKEAFLHLPVRSLKSGVHYKASVKARAQEYNSTWSEWSRSISWYNSYGKTLEQRLPADITIACVVILATCVSCYFLIIKIKKEWWDQIPNPARSPLIAIIIEDSQVSLWGKPSRGQKPAKFPRWKTCLAKLLPCFLEHNKERDVDPPKTVRQEPSQGPEKSGWHPVELSKTVLWPESISVVRCVELLDAQVEDKEEDAEEDRGSFCPSPESSGLSFQEGREGIAARLTEGLFLNLLGEQDGVFSPQGLEESVLSSLSGSGTALTSWAEFPGTEPKEAVVQGEELEPTSLAVTEMSAVVTDNPAYRSFSTCLSQSPGPGELDSEPQLAAHLGDMDSRTPCAIQTLARPPSLWPELESWEQILRQRVLQHGAALAAASAPASGYREFVSALKQGGTQDGGAEGFGPPEESGYKAFSSLLASSAISPGVSGVEGSSEEGGYKPFQSLLPGSPEASGLGSAPQLTSALDMEPAPSPQRSLSPVAPPELLSLAPVLQGEDSQKPPFPPEQATDPLRDDLGTGVVYSALTCHLCGHLKQCHSPEEHGEAHAAAGPCCGCRCGDRASPLVSSLGALDPLPGGLQLEASVSLASTAPVGVSDKNKSLLSCQPALSDAPHSGQPLKRVAVAPTESPCRV